MVTPMRKIRHDNPSDNPRLKVDAKRQPRRDHRTFRADAADPIRDAQDRTAARRDAALAGIRGQHKSRKGVTRDNLRQGPSKPQAAPKPAMDADAARQAAHDAIRGAARRDK